MQYPASPIEPVEEKLHGQTLIDNFRWLEDDSSKPVKKWTNEQNKLVTSHLQSDPQFSQYETELMQLLSVDTQSTPAVRKGRYFFVKQAADQDHGVLCYQDGLTADPVIIIDPNAITTETGKSTAIHYWSPSPSGRFINYGLMIEGHEMSDLIIYDLKADKAVATLPFHRSPGSWLKDESGLYHSQFPDPKTVPKGEEMYHTKFHFYDLLSHKDEMVFGEGFHKEMSFGCGVSPDGKYVIVSASRGWQRNDLYIAKTADHNFTPLMTGYDATFGLTCLADRVILSTNYKAPFRRILMAKYDNLPSKPEDWQEIVPEREDAMVGWGVTSQYLIVEYLHNAASQVEILTYDGEKAGDLVLPPLSSLMSLQTNPDEAEFFYSFDNFLVSQTINWFNPKTKQGELFRKADHTLDPKKYQATQEWYVYKDGTKIPMFILSKKSVPLDGTNRVAMYGYGGFKNSQTPGYLHNWVPFVEKGGIFVMTNIRGGGEFGREWHEGGINENKQNGFDDFIAAAEHLVEKKYTSPQHLGIVGGSNGGLLVAACEVQRPDLFAAVVCRVPLIDMVRFPMFLIASRWVEEYGDPDKKADFERIIKWSPYHNVRKETDYPATLITTGSNDNRVAPLHARKFAAFLQAASIGSHPIYLYTDTKRGHGPGQGRRQGAFTQALVLTFLDQSL